MKEKKLFLPWLMSFFTKKMVKTGEGFTSSDKSLPQNQVKRSNLVNKTHTGCSQCSTKSNIEFTFVGLTNVDGKVKYRLYHDKTRRLFDVDEKLFELIFKFSRTPINVRSN